MNNATFREFNPVDGYFALVTDKNGELFAKVYTRKNAQLIVAMLEKNEQVQS